MKVFAIGDPDRTYPISLSPIDMNNPQLFSDAPFNQFYDLNSVSITNSVSLKLKEDLPNYINYAFTATITFDLTYTDLNNQTLPSQSKSVKISYDPGTGTKYDAESYFAFRNAKSVSVTVRSISISSHQADVMTYLIFTNRFQSKRDYNFNYNLFPAISTVSPSSVAASWQTPDELGVTWQDPNISNGSDIDVEWAWINTSDAVVVASYQTNGAYDQTKIFADNATRVTVPYNYLDVKNPVFKIPLLYEAGGTLFFRTRFAQLKNDGTRIEGVWNTSSQLANNLWQFAFNNDQTSYKLNGHMPEMNWQATTSFAEEGKRKTVISYFDGTLRTRQTVTKDNSIEQIDPATGHLVSKPTTVVAETMYDYQGRPVIQVLPAPTISNLVEYTHHFNVFLGHETQYPKEVYDILAPGDALCAKAAPALSTQSVSKTGLPIGSANYYSPNNPLKNIDVNGKYIPDANGFPFTETRYTTDGTGRVDAQGGVGQTHRLGNGHETKYYYSQADQTELDGLFGTDVGDASHYFKSVVKDANGQYSVSYTDMYGKTIATALAGNNPANLKPVPDLDNQDQSRGSFHTTTKSLLGSNVAKGTAIEAVSSVFLTQPGNAAFNYSLDPQNLKLGLANCNNQNICYDCKYNLEITVSSSCGGSYTLNGQVGTLPYAYTSPVFDLSSLNSTDCNSANTIVSASFTLGLGEGEYTVTKSLRVNTQARDWYLNNKVLQPSSSGGNICKTQADITNDFLTLINISNPVCKPTCATCTAALGDEDAYVHNTILTSGATSTPELVAQLKASWENQKANCDQLCNATAPAAMPDELATIRQTMLADMTPPSGQYARLDETKPENQLSADLIDPATGQAVPLQDYTSLPFNIFNMGDNANVAHPPAYRWPSTDGTTMALYLGVNGNADLTIHPANQTDPYAKLNDIKPENFSSLFKDSWAASLLAYHPEYAKLRYAETTLKATYQFNTNLFNVDNIFDNNNNVTNDWVANIFGTAGNNTIGFHIIANDPFASIAGSGFAVNMANKINNYTTSISGNYTLTMWEVAARSVICPDQLASTTSCTTIRNGNDLISSGLCTADKNRIWQAFRGLYTSERRKMVYAFLNNAAPSKYNFTANPNNYTARFIDLQTWQVAAQAQNPDPTNIIAQTKDQYNSIAQSYVPKWTAELMACQTISSISDEATRTNFIKSITDELVKICVDGSDEDHPAGASTCPARTDGGTFLSFEAVIASKMANIGLGAGSYTTTCNPYIIDWPKPYNFPVAFSNQSISSKDPCVCDRITDLTRERDNRGLAGTPLSTYLLNYYQVTIPQTDLDKLSAVCNGNTTCNTISPPVTIPPLLQCSYHYQTSCIDCATIQGYDAGFRDEFQDRAVFGPFADPANNANNTDDQIAQQQAANRFYAQYLNKKTGFSKSYDEYAIFLQKCTTAITNVAPVGGGTTNNTIAQTDGIAWPVYDSTAMSNSLALNTFSTTPTDPQPYPANWVPDCDTRFEWGYHNGGYGYLGSFIYNTGFAADGSGTKTELPGTLWKNTCGNGNCGPLNRTSIWVRDNPSTANDVWVPVKRQLYFPASGTYYVGFAADNYVRFSFDGSLLITNSSHTNFYTWNIYPVWVRKGYHTFSVDGQNEGSGGAGVGCEIYNCTLAQLQQTSSFTNYNQLLPYILYSTDNEVYTKVGNIISPCGTPAPNGPLLCDTSSVIPPTYTINLPTCDEQHATLAAALAEDKYTLELSQVKGDFENVYNQKCLSAINLESFTVTHTVAEYHYTLYYYDQAGNLAQTVPPAGVHPRYNDPTFLANVKAARACQQTANCQLPTVNYRPDHTLVTRYLHNSLNLTVQQRTPDAGITNTWYDRMGRLAISQNAKQAVPFSTGGEGLGVRYSYTVYDVLGRPSEVGQKPLVSPMAPMAQSISQDEAALASWLATGNNKQQMTTTVYDLPYGPFIGNNTVLQQANLRNRISYVQLWDNQADPAHKAATFYTYDIHRNVDQLLQDINQGSMMTTGNRFKKIAYDYDLISGKVNQVQYQPPYHDANNQLFYNADYIAHKYSYDAENRLTSAFATTDDVHWEKLAGYNYYRHGPLARTVLGQLQVQGLDYAYTIQGWLKAINPGAVWHTTDGSCAIDGSANPDRLVTDREREPPINGQYTAQNSITFDAGFTSAQNDVWETVLGVTTSNTCTTNNLYDDDGTAGSLVARDAFGLQLSYYGDADYTPIGGTPLSASPTPLGINFKPLYNGNIAAMMVNLPKLGEPIIYGYGYDQLNRLIATDAYRGLNTANANWTPITTTDYKERFSYNPDGGITNLLRNGANGNVIDNASWNYYPGTHRLEHIADPAGRHGFDAGMQNANNYTWNEIGEMTADNERGLTGMDWTVYGKIWHQVMNGTGISYTYGPSGKRLSKTVGGTNGYSEYYVHDASGNVMAIYKGQNNVLKLSELGLYGSSKLGGWQLGIDVTNPVGIPANGRDRVLTRGQQYFIVSDHRGNNYLTVSDRAIPISLDGVTIHHRTADVITAQDYSSFGSLLDGRQFGGTPRYTYDGKQLDGETGWQDYGMREYGDGFFPTPDPLTSKYPELTPYQFASNRPIDGIDLDGMEYLSPMDQYKYDGSGWDYLKWIPNAAGNIYNGLIAGTWNSGVTTVVNLKHGTYLKNLGNETQQIGQTIKQVGINTWNYNTKTPIGQQFIDAGKTAISPQTWEQGLTLYLGSKIPTGLGGKGNLLKINASTSILAQRIELAENFLQKAGVSEIERHMAAIHFESEVYTSTLPKGSVLYRFSKIGATDAKHYFSPDEWFTPDMAGKISAKYNSQNFVLEKFTLNKPVNILNSTVNLDGNPGVKQVFSTEIQGASKVEQGTWGDFIKH